MYLTRKWRHRDPDSDKLVCTLCPRECHIPEGGRGFCFVRANVGGELALTTYGRSSGFCIDPIEKKPLNHFLPGTPVLSLGTAGCNLGCKFCQNWDISKSREMDTLAATATPQAIVQAAQQTGCRSIAFTYNDPIIWAEYAIDIAKVARQAGIKTVAVTAGYISPQARGEFFQWMDAANVDFKAFTETFYRKLTQTHLQPVLDTLKFLKHETDVWFELTNLVIPGENDSPQELAAMCRWVVDELGDDVPMHFSAFHPDFKMKDTPRTPHETLIRARQTALDAGVKYAYVGNVYDLERESTYCHNCGTCVIERDWYQLGAYRLNGNQCQACGTVIPGVFESEPGAPGDWGRKRMPIRIGGVGPGDAPIDPASLTTSLTASVANQSASAPSSAASSGAPPTTQPSPSNQATAPMTDPSQTTPEPDATASDAAATPADAPRIEFDAEQAQAIARFARAAVAAKVLGQPIADDDQLPPDLAEAPAWGLFVTLKRRGQLRGCLGRWGRILPLASLLTEIAGNTASQDTRFPRIDRAELDLLSVEVSLMHDPQMAPAKGDALAEAIRVGEHGLCLSHPQGRGLLLPQVATEHGYDAPQFLSQVCLKANLPADTWRRDDRVELMTFRCCIMHAKPLAAELAGADLPDASKRRLLDAACNLIADAGPPQEAIDDSLLNQPWPGELGLKLASATGMTGFAAGAGLSLLELSGLAAKPLRELAIKRQGQVQRLAAIRLYLLPVKLHAADYPARHRLVVPRQAVLARAAGAWAMAEPNPQQPQDTVGQALRDVNLSPAQWTQNAGAARGPRLTAFDVVTLQTQANQQYREDEKVRPPARAGQFYPADAAEMNRAIDAYLAPANADDSQTDSAGPALKIANNSKPPHAAIMLPHAGWRFCGATMGKTLAVTRIPNRVIILGPKHTPHGADLSITPHQAWAFPGAQVPVDTDLVASLLDAIPDLRCEPQAHQMEHGSEVIVPFLYRLNPQVRIAPIVVGRCDNAQLHALAMGLSRVLQAAPSDDKPLLIISSDMNHFAPEQENRRRDMLALDAMQTGDPAALLKTCRDNDISMCGLLPAAAVMQALRTTTGQDLTINRIDYTNSFETTGDPTRVVGYAGVTIN